MTRDEIDVLRRLLQYGVHFLTDVEVAAIQSAIRAGERSLVIADHAAAEKTLR